MKKYYEDKKYLSIVDDILEHSEFKKLGNYIHHGGTRLDHCIRVSYHSYKVCKFFHLNSKSAARAGLLHDFFFIDNLSLDIKTRLKVLVDHPKYACNNAKKCFKISKLEEDIILSHMFPVGIRVPRRLESWIVNLVDDFDAINERIINWIKQLSSAIRIINKQS